MAIEQLPKRHYSDSLPRQQSKRFYQTPEWKRLRARKKQADRRADELIIEQLYESSRDNRPSHLNAFMESSNPLCEMCKAKGLLRVAYYLDHKKRIRDGGHKTDPANLQWLCKPCDATKRGREAHE